MFLKVGFIFLLGSLLGIIFSSSLLLGVSLIFLFIDELSNLFINILCHGFTLRVMESITLPLHLAVTKGKLNIVLDLIDKGADIEAKNKNSYTPLHRAIKKGQIDIAKLLIDKGADIEAKNKNGYTPLHWTIREGQIDIAKLLLDNGANISLNLGPIVLNQSIYSFEAVNMCLSQQRKISTFIEDIEQLSEGTMDNSQFFDKYKEPSSAAGCEQFSIREVFRIKRRIDEGKPIGFTHERLEEILSNLIASNFNLYKLYNYLLYLNLDDEDSRLDEIVTKAFKDGYSDIIDSEAEPLIEHPATLAAPTILALSSLFKNGLWLSINEHNERLSENNNKNIGPLSLRDQIHRKLIFCCKPGNLCDALLGEEDRNTLATSNSR